MSSRPEMPWEKLGWDDDFMQIIYREYGIYFSKKFILDKAAIYYAKSLDIKENDIKALKNRSLCSSAIADTAKAYMEITKALEIDKYNQAVNLQYNNVVYEQCDFEKCIVNISANIERFKTAIKKKPFQAQKEVLEGTFINCLGDSLSPFIQKKFKYLEIAKKKVDKERNPVVQLLWRQQKELGQCDVLSVIEESAVKLHPREFKRRELCYTVYNQIYMQRSWSDVMLLSRLRRSKTLCLPQTPKSTKFFAEKASYNYSVLQKFMKMLQIQSPMYNEKCRIYGKRETQQLEVLLFRAQSKIRRNAMNLIKLSKFLRQQGEIRVMANEIEDFLGKIIILKTNRVMPWKFEFLNEITNIYALANIDFIRVPKDLEKYSNDVQLVKLLNATEKEKQLPLDYVFGDRTTYNEPDVPDVEFMAYKRKSSNFEARLFFSEYSIEKCFLYHELARSHLEQGKYDDCITTATRCIRESKLIGNRAYLLLGNLLIAKSHAVQRKHKSLLPFIGQLVKLSAPLKKKAIIECFNQCTIVIEAALAEQLAREIELEKAAAKQ